MSERRGGPPDWTSSIRLALSRLGRVRETRPSILVVVSIDSYYQCHFFEVLSPRADKRAHSAKCISSNDGDFRCKTTEVGLHMVDGRKPQMAGTHSGQPDILHATADRNSVSVSDLLRFHVLVEIFDLSLTAAWLKRATQRSSSLVSSVFLHKTGLWSGRSVVATRHRCRFKYHSQM